MMLLIPGMWYAEDDKIYIRQPDGSYDSYETSWEKQRREVEFLQRTIEDQFRSRSLKEHLSNKRKKEKKNPGRGQ